MISIFIPEKMKVRPHPRHGGGRHDTAPGRAGAEYRAAMHPGRRWLQPVANAWRLPERCHTMLESSILTLTTEETA
jgi:hypothetical protein